MVAHDTLFIYHPRSRAVPLSSWWYMNVSWATIVYLFHFIYYTVVFLLPVGMKIVSQTSAGSTQSVPGTTTKDGERSYWGLAVRQVLLLVEHWLPLQLGSLVSLLTGYFVVYNRWWVCVATTCMHCTIRQYIMVFMTGREKGEDWHTSFR